MAVKPRRTPHDPATDPHARLYNPLDRAAESRLALSTQLARAELLSHLTEKEIRTVRLKGGAIREMEDAAQLVVDDSADPRSGAVGLALASYRQALNVFWAKAVGADVGGILATRFRRRYPRYAERVSWDLLKWESSFALRKVCARLQPDRAPLIAFAQRRIFDHLRIVCSRAAAGVEVPQSAALDRPLRELESQSFDTD